MEKEGINYVQQSQNTEIQNGNMYVQRHEVEREPFKTDFNVQLLPKYTMYKHSQV